MGFFDTISKLGRSLARGSGDFFLRLNYIYTPIFLAVLSLLSLLLILVYVPVPPTVTSSCWTPAEFTEAHVNYAKAVCAPDGPGQKYEWLEPGDMRQPNKTEITIPETPRLNHRMPLWFLFQAILFIVPIFFWKAAIGRTGISVNDVTHDSNEKMVEKFVRQFDQYFGNLKRKRANFPCAPLDNLCLHINKFFGFYLILVFIVLKIWYIYNITLQFNVMSIALGREVGPSTILFKNMTVNTVPERILENANSTTRTTTDTTNSPIYLCDFYTRRLGNVHTFRVQCYAKIQAGSSPSPLMDDLYKILVVWLSFLFVANIYSFLSFLLTVCRAHVPIKHQLLLARLQPEEHQRQLADEFVDSYLTQDGAFLLGMIDKNTNKGVATDILEALWERYLTKKHEGDVSESAKIYPNLQQV
ncbi:innexin unc-7-like [Lingula anatina]|uniref:Innexin n=1 Tax=Lingula anatina TaxID=7574 RepID=A0A1S3JII7_LINAN|nr:innexin unc-7-like [Lingula anatina]XP_013410183.1 innexin unc-7-like [Lingula anatina]|eukprot:XP_013410182.1 innexin unc-7-like [Lingula anatina]